MISRKYHLLRQLTYVILALSFSCIVMQAAEKQLEEKHTLMLADFEDPMQASRFIPMRNNPQKLTQVSDPALVISGKGSGCWYVPPEGPGEHQWPRANYILPENQRNWDLYDQLEVDIYNPLNRDSRFGFEVYDTNNGKYSCYTRNVPPGHSTFVWSIPDNMRGCIPIRFMLATAKPVEEYTLYLDNIRLTTSRKLFMQRVDRQIIRLQGDWQQSLWAKAGMLKEFEQFHKELNELKNSTAPLGTLLQKMQDHTVRYKKAVGKLIARLNELAVRDFDKVYSHSAVWGYGWTSGMQKVYRQDLPYLGKIGGTAKLNLARRESEAVQIIVRSRRKITQVKLLPGTLRSTSGNTLPPEAIKVFMTGHVKTKKQSYPATPARWSPDPLLECPENGFTLDSDVWQAFFIDVTATADVAPGLYEGKVFVTGQNVPQLEVPLKIRIWNFTLPQNLTQPALIGFQSDYNHCMYVEDKLSRDLFIKYKEGKVKFTQLTDGAKKLLAMEEKCQKLLLDHLLAPTSLYNYRRQLQVKDILTWNRQRGTACNIGYVPPMQVKYGEPYPAWAENLVMKNLDYLVPELSRHDLLQNSYLYSFDEITKDKFFAAKSILSTIKKRYPTIKTLTTAYDRDFGRSNGLDKVVDCWCPQVERFEEQLETIRQVQKSGKKVWYYSCMWDPGMDLLIEKPLTAPRLLIGLNQIRLGSDGFLYYAVNEGQMRHKLLNNASPLTDHDGEGFLRFNGDGLLFYATDRGPTPAIRLKALRDGMEDIEYCRLLQKIPAAVMSKRDLLLRNKLVKIPREVITDLEIFDQTGDALNLWRNQAGMLLDSYSKYLPAIKVPSKKPVAAPVQADLTLTLRKYPVYSLGENAEFSLAFTYKNKPVKSGIVTVDFTNSGNQILRSEVVDLSRNNPAKLNITLNEPGIVVAQCRDLQNSNGFIAKNLPLASAAFAPEAIKPAAEAPADFMEFWQKGLDATRNAPVTVVPFDKKKYADHNPFLVTVDMPQYGKFYAVMLVPKNQRKGMIFIDTPGAGPGMSEFWPGKEEADKILIRMHVHKYPPIVNNYYMKKYYDDFNRNLGKLYQYDGAPDPEKYFFRRVFLGMSRVLDYAVTLPEWDQKNVMVSGTSQGGACSMALAALNPHVTMVRGNEPAMCDQNGFLAGRKPGWPNFHENVPNSKKLRAYYDIVNFARYIKAPVFMSVGYLDLTAPAAGNYAAYNQLKGEKRLFPMFNRSHGLYPDFYKHADAFLNKFIR